MSIQQASSGVFGDLLRYWRGVRRVSQLDLAVEAEISTKHLSFLETGRSRPSREMVQRLAGVLSLPLREKNELLTAAGFARMHRQSGLGEPALARYRQVIQLILDKQEPYPALVMDRHWDIVAMNRGAQAHLACYLAPRTLGRYRNAMELLFAEDGLQPVVENWESVASAMLARIYREHADSPSDERLSALYEKLASAPGVPADWRGIAAGAEPGPVLPLILRKKGLRSSLFTTITTFGTPHDVTLQELRIESYFPADAETRQLLESLAGAP